VKWVITHRASIAGLMFTETFAMFVYLEYSCKRTSCVWETSCTNQRSRL